MYVMYVKCKILCQRMSKYDIINVLFVSSRPRERCHGYQIHKVKETVNVAVPSDIIKRLLIYGAGLQIQIGAVKSLPCSRPDSANPGLCQGQIQANLCLNTVIGPLLRIFLQDWTKKRRS